MIKDLKSFIVGIMLVIVAIIRYVSKTRSINSIKQDKTGQLLNEEQFKARIEIFIIGYFAIGLLLVLYSIFK